MKVIVRSAFRARFSDLLLYIIAFLPETLISLSCHANILSNHGFLSLHGTNRVLNENKCEIILTHYANRKLKNESHGTLWSLFARPDQRDNSVPEHFDRARRSSSVVGSFD